MIFQFSDGEFSDPIATSLKMWKKKSIVLSLFAFSILRHLNDPRTSRDHLRSMLGIIYARGSFAVGDHLCYCTSVIH